MCGCQTAKMSVWLLSVVFMMFALRVVAQCPAGYYCSNGQHLCPRLYYCPAGTSAAIECEADKYCPDEGMSEGYDCGFWKFSKARADVCSSMSLKGILVIVGIVIGFTLFVLFIIGMWWVYIDKTPLKPLKTSLETSSTPFKLNLPPEFESKQPFTAAESSTSNEPV
jgi:hypothetical protein